MKRRLIGALFAGLFAVVAMASPASAGNGVLHDLRGGTGVLHDL